MEKLKLIDISNEVTEFVKTFLEFKKGFKQLISALEQATGLEISKMRTSSSEPHGSSIEQMCQKGYVQRVFGSQRNLLHKMELTFFADGKITLKMTGNGPQEYKKITPEKLISLAQKIKKHLEPY